MAKVIPLEKRIEGVRKLLPKYPAYLKEDLEQELYLYCFKEYGKEKRQFDYEHVVRSIIEAMDKYSEYKLSSSDLESWMVPKYFDYTDDFLDMVIDISNLEDQLHTLTPREEKVIRYRFLSGFYTLRDIAPIFHVKQERIRQIEAKALRKLRHRSRTDMEHCAVNFKRSLSNLKIDQKVESCYAAYYASIKDSKPVNVKKEKVKSAKNDKAIKRTKSTKKEYTTISHNPFSIRTPLENYDIWYRKKFDGHKYDPNKPKSEAERIAEFNDHMSRRPYFSSTTITPTKQNMIDLQIRDISLYYTFCNGIRVLNRLGGISAEIIAFMYNKPINAVQFILDQDDKIDWGEKDIILTLYYIAKMGVIDISKVTGVDNWKVLDIVTDKEMMSQFNTRATKKLREKIK